MSAPDGMTKRESLLLEALKEILVIAEFNHPGDEKYKCADCQVVLRTIELIAKIERGEL